MVKAIGSEKPIELLARHSMLSVDFGRTGPPFIWVAPLHPIGGLAAGEGRPIVAADGATLGRRDWAPRRASSFPSIASLRYGRYPFGCLGDRGRARVSSPWRRLHVPA
jgi:hypothetical protein